MLIGQAESQGFVPLVLCIGCNFDLGPFKVILECISVILFLGKLKSHNTTSSWVFCHSFSTELFIDILCDNPQCYYYFKKIMKKHCSQNGKMRTRNSLKKTNKLLTLHLLPWHTLMSFWGIRHIFSILLFKLLLLLRLWIFQPYILYRFTVTTPRWNSWIWKLKKKEKKSEET